MPQSGIRHISFFKPLHRAVDAVLARFDQNHPELSHEVLVMPSLIRSVWLFGFHMIRQSTLTCAAQYDLYQHFSPISNDALHILRLQESAIPSRDIAGKDSHGIGSSGRLTGASGRPKVSRSVGKHPLPNRLSRQPETDL
jgi:hypothetical protein